MIVIDGLVKQYGDFKLDISMEVHPGMVTGIVGKNGAGKSTTIKAILGLIKPDSGSVRVFGKNVSDFTIQDKEQIGVSLAESGFSSYFNIKDISAVLRRMYKKFDADKFEKLCAQYNLPKDKRIKEFSTGMKAKLRVLVAISHNAKLLILDEPTSGLDVTARNFILDMLREYLAEDEERALVITSHISSDLEGLCDDIYIIGDGKVILHEDTDSILGNYAVIKVNDKQYNEMDKQYILKTKKEPFGYVCLTKEKQYYIDNYPNIIIENGNIDDLILMM